MSNYSLLCGICALATCPVTGQLIQNPDFENNCDPDDSGWSGGVCWALGPGFSSCEALEFDSTADWTTCSVHTPIVGLQQDIPYELVFFARKTENYLFGNVSILGFADGQIPFSGVEPFFATSVPLSFIPAIDLWTELSWQFMIPSSFPELDYYLSLDPVVVDGYMGAILFDHFSINDLTTGFTSPKVLRPSFHPNPVDDKLWVDLPEVPLAITAIDASGRTHDLKNFTHRDHTLEVDVNSLPAGITLLRITTNSGTQNLRFLKM